MTTNHWVQTTDYRLLSVELRLHGYSCYWTAVFHDCNVLSDHIISSTWETTRTKPTTQCFKLLAVCRTDSWSYTACFDSLHLIGCQISAILPTCWIFSAYFLYSFLFSRNRKMAKSQEGSLNVVLLLKNNIGGSRAHLLYSHKQFVLVFWKWMWFCDRVSWGLPQYINILTYDQYM